MNALWTISKTQPCPVTLVGEKLWAFPGTEGPTPLRPHPLYLSVDPVDTPTYPVNKFTWTAAGQPKYRATTPLAVLTCDVIQLRVVPVGLVRPVKKWLNVLLYLCPEPIDCVVLYLTNLYVLPNPRHVGLNIIGTFYMVVLSAPRIVILNLFFIQVIPLQWHTSDKSFTALITR